MVRTATEAQLRAVWGAHGRAMQLYATRLLGDPVGAEDVVQEALFRLWRRPEVLDEGRGSLRSWLLTVIRNIVIDGVRARGARPTEVPEDPDRPPVQPDHADAVAASVTVHEALGHLSPEHRAVLEQIYLHGRTLGEVATALGIPTGTVKSRSHNAIRAIRAAMSIPANPSDHREERL